MSRIKNIFQSLGVKLGFTPLIKVVELLNFLIIFSKIPLNSFLAGFALKIINIWYPIMSRIKNIFQGLKKQGQKAFIPLSEFFYQS
jgi:hypothetical protein